MNLSSKIVTIFRNIYENHYPKTLQLRGNLKSCIRFQNATERAPGMTNIFDTVGKGRV